MKLSILLLLAVCGLIAARTAVLREFSANGTKNVKYTTFPNNFMDANGNPVKGNVPGSPNACYDMEGRVRKDGEEYQRANKKFFFRCNNGIEEVVSCVATERLKNARLNIGESRTENGLWHKCEKLPDGRVQYSQQSSCTVNGKEIPPGQTFTVASMAMICEEAGFKIKGCAYKKDGKTVEMAPGSTAETEGLSHNCEDTGTSVQYSAKRNTCEKNGKVYKEGEKFSGNHIRYQCSNGIAQHLACFIDEHRDLPIGKDIIEKNMVYRCYRSGGLVHYEEYSCGFAGLPTCNPTPIPDTPNDAPSLFPGLKVPGVASFSVVSNQGGMAGGPIQLQLKHPN